MKQQVISLNLSMLPTCKAVFLDDEINLVVPWRRLLSLIAPRAKTKGSSFELVAMLRIFFLQKRFGLSYLSMKEALSKPGLNCEFVGLSSVDRIFDNVSILRLCHLLEKHQSALQMLTAFNTALTNKGWMLKPVETTFTATHSSTTKKNGKRPPEDAQDDKGKSVAFWHEKSHWRGRSLWSGSYRGGYGHQRQRCDAVHCIDPE